MEGNATEGRGSSPITTVKEARTVSEMIFLPDLGLLVKIHRDRFGEYLVIPKGKGRGLIPEGKKIYSLRKRR